MAELVLGPLLRHAGRDDATIWVETDRACEVEVLGRRSRTFHVAGHHYALVILDDLAPGSHAYEVHLDGERRWPDDSLDFPPSRIRTARAGATVRLAFGSCRVAAPHEPPFSLPRLHHRDGHGTDALVALATRMVQEPEASWPDALVLLGDQVYADAASPGTRAFIRARRSTAGPHGDEVRDFEEYAMLYRETWGDPTTRWLLSTVPSVMIFDDHDVHDDWNTSLAWRSTTTAQPWWDPRIAGAFASYWIYQHLGNMSRAELASDDLYPQVLGAEDGGPILHEFGRRSDQDPTLSRWSYRRDIGSVRLVVIDSRAGRVLSEASRDMMDANEWAWLEEQATGGVDHLVLATSLPFMLPPAIHHLEAWDEAVAAGAWGGPLRSIAERLRQALDLEHWAAFQSSFLRLADMLRSVAAGERGRSPATIVLISGDLHSTYLARGRWPADPDIAVYQAVCSPLRNEGSPGLARAQRLGWSAAATGLARRLARRAGVRAAPLDWSLVSGPYFQNALGTLEFSGDRADLRFEVSGSDGSGRALLTTVAETGLTPSSRSRPER